MKVCSILGTKGLQKICFFSCEKKFEHLKQITHLKITARIQNII